jgi:hypothetical protein
MARRCTLGGVHRNAVRGYRLDGIDHHTSARVAWLSASRVRRGDDLANATFRLPSQQRHDVLAHPRSANLTSDSVGVFWTIEHEDENEVPAVDFGNVGGPATGVYDTLHGFLRALDDLLRNWITQVQVVYDDVHEPTVSGYRKRSSTNTLRAPHSDRSSPKH